MMSGIQMNYQILSNEIDALNNEIIKLSHTNIVVKNLYKGCQVLYSDVMERPKFFLMGINPGSGYYKWYGRPVQRLAPRNTLEYVEKGMDYVLAKETREVFMKADLYKYLENQTVKSNMFYFSTNNTTDLWKLMSIINNDIDDPYTLAHNWTRRLLAMTKPEIILCEGKKAFDELITCLGGKPIGWGDSAAKETILAGYKIIGYRRRWSFILNKHDLISTLKASAI